MAPKTKAQALWDALIDMYNAEGVQHKIVDPNPNQSFEAFRKHAKASAKLGTVVMTKKPYVLRQFNKVSNDNVSALLYFHNGEELGARSGDFEGTVRIFRAHARKFLTNESHPDECRECGSVSRGTSCPACFENLCNNCLINETYETGRYDCGACGASFGIGELFDAVRFQNMVYVAADYNAAILRAMEELDTTSIAVDVVNRQQTIAVTATCPDTYANLQKTTDRPKALKKMLKLPGTMILVGSRPDRCDSCDRLHSQDVFRGFALEITDDGSVFEAEKMYALWSIQAEQLRRGASLQVVPFHREA